MILASILFFIMLMLGLYTTYFVIVETIRFFKNKIEFGFIIILYATQATVFAILYNVWGIFKTLL